MTQKYLGPYSPYDQPEIKEALDEKKLNERYLILGENFYTEVLALMKEFDIEVMESSFRLKSPERIKEKVENAKTYGKGNWPIADIYGVRLIVQRKVDIKKVVDTVRQRWPTPETLPWGMKSLRHGGNRFSVKGYAITKVNILFGSNKLAEIQVLTSKQKSLEIDTREIYMAERSKSQKRS